MRSDPENVGNGVVGANKSPKINLDTILVEEIGHFGKFQLWTLVLALIAGLFLSFSGGEYMFTTARISTRCLIPECDGEEPEWAPSWLSNAVPVTSQGAIDNCQRYGNLTALTRIVESDTCPSTFFDTNILQPCDEYVYENTHSVVYDFGLACKEWSRSLIGTFRLLGTMIAYPATGYVSDRWGRRLALTITCFGAACLGLARYFTNTYFGFVVCEFLEAAIGYGGVTCAYILFAELSGPKLRVIAGAAIHTSHSVGQAALGLIAWAIPNWRRLTLVLYTPQLLTLSYYWIISESVRWYMVKGRFDESEALLKKMARINGRTLSDKSLKAIRLTAEEENKNKALEAERSGTEPWLIVQVFRHKQILLRCIVTSVWWITTLFIYYSLSINATNFSGNKYVNFIAVSLAEIPGFWSAMFFMGKIGRRPVVLVAYWVCAVCQITYIFTPHDTYAALLTLYLIGKYSIAMSATVIYVYSAELFPTKRRHSLMAVSLMVGRIGTVVAPLTPAISQQWFENLPFVLFAGFAILSGVLAFFMPETNGSKLPDTFEEAVNIGLEKNETAQ